MVPKLAMEALQVHYKLIIVHGDFLNCKFVKRVSMGEKCDGRFYSYGRAIALST